MLFILGVLWGERARRGQVLVAWFGRRWIRQGPLARRAGRGAYAAYLLHPLVLVVVSFAARPLPLPPEVKFLLVALAGVSAAFSLGGRSPAWHSSPASCEYAIDALFPFRIASCLMVRKPHSSPTVSTRCTAPPDDQGTLSSPDPGHGIGHDPYPTGNSRSAEWAPLLI